MDHLVCKRGAQPSRNRASMLAMNNEHRIIAMFAVGVGYSDHFVCAINCANEIPFTAVTRNVYVPCKALSVVIYNLRRQTFKKSELASCDLQYLQALKSFNYKLWTSCQCLDLQHL